MRRAAARAAALGLALAAALAAACDRRDELGTRPLADVETPDFDGQAAYALVESQVAFGPRVPGTAGHAEQLAWMEAYLRERADTVILQPFDHRAASGEAVRMTNVFARFRPDAGDRILLLTHWDTRPMADNDPDTDRRDEPIVGANDGASGVAVLLQLADVLSRHSPPIGVDLLFTDGEDFGPGEMYLGATYFAANPVPGPGYRPLYGVLIDMVGDRNPVFPIEPLSYDFAPEAVERVWRLAGELGYGHVFVRRHQGAIGDDHVPLNRAGIRTIDIIDFEYGPGNAYWHTSQDVLENTAPDGLEAVGTVLTALVYRGG
ncbi:MAG TPA: M28 family peptidase [Longimicrobiales bacterium]